MMPGLRSLRHTALVAVALAGASAAPLLAQDSTVSEDPDDSAVAEAVALDEVPADERIDERLEGILAATGWFETVEVRVESGVVFLAGTTGDERRVSWAGELARNTEGVVAVVNDMEVTTPSPWDLSPTVRQIRELAATAFRALPLVLIGLVLLGLTWALARALLGPAGRLLDARVRSDLLRDVLARTFAALVFVIGLYVVLRVSGLTGLAVTIIGGTGLLGLAIGFAFRDIAENFLASVLISIQRPFAMGDLIEVDGHEGYVQRVNTRATVIMTRDGNHVQVPNAIIYKNTIVNFTANPRARESFVVGIGYADAVPDAQSIALDVLKDHPAVLEDPEPLVLVDQLGAATVNLHVLFWIDIEAYSQLKVRSAVIRLTKSAFEANGISMPDEAREVVFPDGVPIYRTQDTAEPALPKRDRESRDTRAAHQAEGDLANEANELERQSRDARLPEGGKNLL